jgi:hypothetical protein
MATKKTSKPKPKPRLQNLAARPPADDEDVLDEQLVDHSGVFRVTSSIQQAQTGHDEEATLRFASESLVMQAQREGFRDPGKTLDDVVEEHTLVDEAARAEKKQRLATLAARAQARIKPRR